MNRENLKGESFLILKDLMSSVSHYQTGKRIRQEKQCFLIQFKRFSPITRKKQSHAETASNELRRIVLLWYPVSFTFCGSLICIYQYCRCVALEKCTVLWDSSLFCESRVSNSPYYNIDNTCKDYFFFMHDQKIWTNPCYLKKAIDKSFYR